MSKAFGKNNGRPNRVKRNAIDGSFQTNGSYNYGGLYPVLCKEALPGDSFEIDITAALRAMPFVFPVQTRQRVEFNAFYVRNRNLWKDWPDFISKTKDGLVPPFISHTSPTEIKTGSLGDYLGLPTTIVGNSSSNSLVLDITGTSLDKYAFFDASIPGSSLHPVVTSATSRYVGAIAGLPSVPYIVKANQMLAFPLGDSRQFKVVPGKNVSVPISWTADSDSEFDFPSSLFNDDTDVTYYSGIYALVSNVVPLGGSSKVDLLYFLSIDSASHMPSGSCFKFQNNIKSGDTVLEFSEVSSESNFTVGYFFAAKPSADTSTVSDPSTLSMYSSLKGSSPVSLTYPSYSVSSPIDISDSSFINPYRTTASSDPQLNVSALPFRAYEQIYNAFYRDDRNNPLIINGQPEYNKYLVNTDGGSDAYEYKLRYRNWEQDCFTTALPSPQQGIAPLVGISSTGAMTFSDPDSGQSYTVQAKLADDADTIVGAEFTENVPNSVARSIVNYATSGISINDFRNVNAFQRWLETNIRRGMKYRDQIKSHYDVDVRYDELDMPEFIGGTTIDINMNTISQTSESSTDGNGWSSALGSYAGNGFAVGRGKHTIKHYCDEHGFIMVIMSIIPVPNYSQTLEKFWLKTDALDYFFPEFGHIGLQAIPNKLLSPLQSAQVSSSAMDVTFGYQRPWYEYLENRDEVHGLLRTQLRNFVLNRVFDGVPTLNEDFLLIDPKQMDEAFAVTDITDKWVGQIYFDIKMKRPVPLYGVPRLESDI